MSHVLCYGQGLEGIVLLKDPVGINLHTNRIQCIFRLTICSLHIFCDRDEHSQLSASSMHSIRRRLQRRNT